ncbi:MAG: hypothetical protein RLZZ455_265 [Candidatus Parcubacteria bacterium]|jgi:16S rRNA (cytosine1402-N4)-methyltransferase
MSNYHHTVLLHEAVDALSVQEGEKYIDATFGGGGHALEIARRGGEVLGIDVDEDALRNFRDVSGEISAEVLKRIKVVKGNFIHIREIAKDKGMSDVSGIIFDLGVSGHQFDAPERGFSFMREGALDMRMDNSLSVKASDLVNGLTKGELILLFERYGEEYAARKIAEAIVSAREREPITTTVALAHIVERAIGRREKIHPATRIFQALRIAVNDELHVLENVLQYAVPLLKREGVLAVISFHSLEDRIVKRTFLDLANKGTGVVKTEKPIVPGESEVLGNPRARSAKLRVFIKN